MRLQYDRDTGLSLNSSFFGGVPAAFPIRVGLRGHNTFYVWGMVDSGEGAPRWAEPDLNLTFFGPAAVAPDITCRVETIAEDGVLRGYRATGRHARAEVVLEIVDDGGELRATLAVRNPQHASGARLPLCVLELQIQDFDLGPRAEFASAHAYGGRTHGYGKLADLVPPGMPFHHGCIGLALPLVYLHDPDRGRGLQFEFMLDGRPTAWVRPGSQAPRASFALQWTPDRLLLPGQVHAVGGDLKIQPYDGRPVQMIRAWRDGAAARYGIRPPAVREWVKRRSCIELWLSPGAYKEFTRIDDPNLYAMLKRWRDWGYNAIMVVAPNPFGKHPLSPFGYEASEKIGGPAAERVMLGWMHELGFHAGIWFTTVGLDKASPYVENRRDWWTHRPNQELYYAWDSTPQTGFVGYAPDGDPDSAGWRRWMLEQCGSLLERGWDGVFIDGCIPRASNHARWLWPGASRNAVEDQVVELAEFIRASGKDAVLTDEDAGLCAQANCEITSGRYTPMAPYLKKAYWDHGMGGGPAELGAPPARIPPEMARDYLLIRYASLLPGAISEDGVEGYCSEEARPWTVVSMLAGPTTFKTHAEYVNDPLTFRQLGDAPPAGVLARDPEHRRKGHEEFMRLLRLRADEPLVGADTPLSIEGVVADGDGAIVGLLRPTPARCLLVLINFADRPAAGRVRLVEPADVPASQRAAAGQPHVRTWHAREIMRSIADQGAAADAHIGDGAVLPVSLGPYGFRIFELSR